MPQARTSVSAWGNSWRQKRILISHEPVRHLNMCVLSQNTTYIQYIFKYKIHTYVHLMVFVLFTIYSQVCVIHNILWCLCYSQYIMVFVLFTIYYGVCVIHNILWCLRYSQYIIVFVLFTIYYGVCVIHNILWCLWPPPPPSMVQLKRFTWYNIQVCYLKWMWYAFIIYV